MALGLTTSPEATGDGPAIGILKRLRTLQGGTVSTGNSSTTALGAGGVFTGVWEDVSNQANVSLLVLSNQRSLAADGLHMQFSDDGVTLRAETIAPVVANEALPLTSFPRAKFFRVVYKFHESIATTLFILQTIYHPDRTLPSVAFTNGEVFINGALRAITPFAVDSASIGPIVVASSLGNRFTRIFGFALTADSPTTFTLRSGASTVIYPQQSLLAGVPFDLMLPQPLFLANGNIGQDINIIQTALVRLRGVVIGARV